MESERAQTASSTNSVAELCSAPFDWVPVALLLVDVTGRIVKANSAECRLLGYPAEEMRGKPVWDFIANEEEQLSQERFRAFLDGLEMTTSYRRRFKTKANDYLICELSVQVINNISENGPFVLLASVDVTKQVAEACFRGECARWMEASFRSLPEATIVLDTLGRIRYLNHSVERLLGWSEAEALGAIAEDLIPWSDVLSSDGTQSAYEFQRGVSLGWSGSATVTARGGIAMRMQIRTEPVVDSNGLVPGNRPAV
jgi:two-component system sporulation sensor kinase A